jgi:hypothetical protein
VPTFKKICVFCKDTVRTDDTPVVVWQKQVNAEGAVVAVTFY